MFASIFELKIDNVFGQAENIIILLWIMKLINVF